MHICHKSGGSLAKFNSFFNEEYLKSIEERVLVYLSDKKNVEQIVQKLEPDTYKQI